ncbi:MAG TPA: hypothetical protein VGE26_02370 [Sphingobacteriaceae bacterium]
MKKVLKLFRNLLLLAGIVFLADRGIGYGLQYFYENERQGDNSKTSYALTRKVKEDVLIFGSSRAAHHYVSDIIQESTGLSCYNVGRDGMKLSYYYVLLKSILSYHKPKAIILDLNHDDFILEEKYRDKMVSALLPYIDRSKAVREYLADEAPLESWKARFSYLYRYNSVPSSLLMNHIGMGQKHILGYEPLKQSKIRGDFKVQMVDNEEYREDPALVREFDAFVKAVRDQGIELYVVYSPSLRRVKYDCINTANTVLASYNMRLFDYSQYFTSNEKQFFYDETHMNNSGAERFTKAFMQSIKVRKNAGENKTDEPAFVQVEYSVR